MHRDILFCAGPAFWGGAPTGIVVFARKKGGIHSLPGDITNAFADQVIDIIGKGLVKSMVPAGPGSPAKKQKVGDSPVPQN